MFSARTVVKIYSFCSKYLLTTAVLLSFCTDVVSASQTSDVNLRRGICAQIYARFFSNDGKVEAQMRTYRSGLTVNSGIASSYDSAWRVITAHDFEANRSVLEKMIADGDPQIGFLQDLGVRINFENGHSIPSIADVGKEIDRRIDDLTKSGRLRPDQTLKPARMMEKFWNSEGDLSPLSLGKNPEKGKVVVDRLKDGSAFLKFVASGNWPVGEISLGLPSNTSIALHDLSHFRVFIQYPEYMAAIREYARVRCPSRQSEKATEIANYIMESLSTAKPGSRDKFAEMLRAVGRPEGTAPGLLKEYSDAVQSLSEPQLASAVESAYSSRLELTYDFGGIVADGFGRGNTKLDRRQIEFHENPKGFIEAAFAAGTLKDRQLAYARYLAAMDHTTRINPEHWIKEFTYRDDLDKKSPIYAYLCMSGIFPDSSSWKRVFCR